MMSGGCPPRQVNRHLHRRGHYWSNAKQYHETYPPMFPPPYLGRHFIGVRHLPFHDARVGVAVAADVVWGQRTDGQELELLDEVKQGPLFCCACPWLLYTPLGKFGHGAEIRPIPIVWVNRGVCCGSLACPQQQLRCLVPSKNQTYLSKK